MLAHTPALRDAGGLLEGESPAVGAPPSAGEAVESTNVVSGFCRPGDNVCAEPRFAVADVIALCKKCSDKSLKRQSDAR
jgi:hypothetical protein